MNPIMRYTPSFIYAVSCSCLLTACSVGENYHKPALPQPSAWSAKLPIAQEADGLSNWWKQLNDPVLLAVLEKSQVQNPSLEEAVARIDKSRATLRSARAAYYPDITAQGYGQRAKQSMGSTGSATTGTSALSGISNTVTGTLDASWELDLFGKTRRTTEAAQAQVEARIADWHDARVSLAAEVADTYIQYRACQMLAANDRFSLASQQQTEKATLASLSAGMTSPADAALSSAAVASAVTTLAGQETSCEVMVKSLVALTGQTEGELRELLQSSEPALPQSKAFYVASVPALALNQRPDLVSLERELAAANADIGAAKANQWPSLSLGATISSSGINLGSMLASWLVSSTLSAPVFDGGERAAAVEGAKADYAYQLAAYKQGLRTAIKEVEQSLVRLDSAELRRESSEKAAQNYKTYEVAAEKNWRAGGLSLLDYQQAHRNRLDAEATAIAAKRDQIEYWIALYKAVGGGWQQNETALTPPTGAKP